MISPTFAVSPNEASIMGSIGCPYTLVVSPAAQSSIPVLKIDSMDFPRCDICGGYYTNSCQSNEEGWICELCNAPNHAKIDDSIRSVSDYEIRKFYQQKMSILTFYISTDFHSKDLEIIFSSLESLLKDIVSSPCLFIVSAKPNRLSLLLPPQSCYSYDENGILVCNDIVGSSTKASIVTADPSKLSDITGFLFHPTQLPCVMHTLKHISHVRSQPSLVSLTSAIAMVERCMDSVPNQMVAVIPTLPKIKKSLTKPESLLYLELLTPVFDKNINENAMIINGRIHLFSGKSLLPTLKYVTQHKPVYEPSFKIRTSNCLSTWKPNILPRWESSNGTVFSQTWPHRNMSLAIDLSPVGNPTSLIIQYSFQCIAWSDEDEGYVLMRRVLNRRINTTDSIETITSSIDINSFMWSIISRSLDKRPREVIPAMYKTLTRITKHMSESQEKHLLIKCRSILQFFNCFQKDEYLSYIGRCHILFNNPRDLSFYPVRVEGGYETINGIYSEDENHPAHMLGFPAVSMKPVPEWCTEDMDNAGKQKE